MQQVLQQQRVEQQRIQQQQQGNQGVDTDPATFINMLPPQLRQQVLSDMDDSQMPTLPADIAAEARELRQELEDRHRRVMQERLFAQGGAASLSAILRNPGMCVSVSGWLVMYSVNRNQKVLFFVLFSCRFLLAQHLLLLPFAFVFILFISLNCFPLFPLSPYSTLNLPTHISPSLTICVVINDRIRSSFPIFCIAAKETDFGHLCVDLDHCASGFNLSGQSVITFKQAEQL